MNLYDWYFKQLVSPAEMTAGFAAAEAAIQSVVQSAGLHGLALNGEVAQRAPTPLIGVSVTGPVVAYDATGNKIYVPSTQNVDVSIDENSASTTVSTVGQERYLSLFVAFERVLSDPRLDGDGNEVFYSRAEGYKFVVAAGAPAAAGTASRPVLRANHVLLADIKLVYGQTSVLNADILTNRTQYVFSITGSPTSIQARNVQEAISDMLTALNGVLGGVVNAGSVAFTPTGTIAATNVQAALAEVASEAGTPQTAATTPFTPVGTIAATDVQAAIAELGTEKAALAGATFTGAISATNVTAPTHSFSPAQTVIRCKGCGAGAWALADGWTFGENAGSLANMGTIFQDINDLLPHNGTLDSVFLTIKPGAVRAPGNRIAMQLRRRDVSNPGAGFTNVGTAIEDDGTTNIQLRYLGGVNGHTIDTESYQYLLSIVAGATGATDLDLYYAVTATSTRTAIR